MHIIYSLYNQKIIDKNICDVVFDLKINKYLCIAILSFI